MECFNTHFRAAPEGIQEHVGGEVRIALVVDMELGLTDTEIENQSLLYWIMGIKSESIPIAPPESTHGVTC